jgi:hypothetical protein
LVIRRPTRSIIIRGDQTTDLTSSAFFCTGPVKPTAVADELLCLSKSVAMLAMTRY